MIVSHTIHIDAPPNLVWTVTEDVERWPEWTPTVRSIVLTSPGPFGVGSVARIKQPLQPESDWTVTEFVPVERFVWSTRRFGLRMTGSHRLTRHKSGTTSMLGVEAEGFIASILSPLLRVAMRRALSQENRGLKIRSEQLADAGNRPRR